MVRNHITRFEALARRLVEGSLGRLVGDENLALQIASQLAKAMEETKQAGVAVAAYRVAVNPFDLRTIGGRVEELEGRLARLANSVNQTSALLGRTKAVVQLIPDETVGRGQVTIETSDALDLGDTTSILNAEIGNAVEELRLLDAFLIVNGRRHVALDKPLIRIGRRTDNDVIIDSPVVSRQHAHLRWRHGRFVIYDVGSRGGIQLNGVLVTESVLAPGDLITLSARVPLIYGEGLENRASLSGSGNETQDTLAYLSGDD